MRRTSLMMIGVCLTSLNACADSSRLTAPQSSITPGRPNASISDAAHGGAAGFYFLAPLVSQPSFSGTLDMSQSSKVRVDVCALAADPSVQSCQQPAVAVSATSPVFVDLNGNHYQVNWNTDATAFPANMYYRISVVDVATGGEWGHVDVFLGATGQGFRGINRAEFTPLLDGRTVPIKFRVENGAVVPGGGGATF